jgi:3-(3-hydroxy-phenyl)propionate hydroxylase
LQDTDNLIWKLKWVLEGWAPQTLLDSYSDERVMAADENLLNSTRSTDFITPKSQASKDFRHAVLDLARDHAFARSLVNSGRLSVPAHLTSSALNTVDEDAFDCRVRPGSPIEDAPVQRLGEAQDSWLLSHLGQRFVLLVFVNSPQDLDGPTLDGLRSLRTLPEDDAGRVTLEALVVSAQTAAPVPGLAALWDVKGTAARRLDATPGTAVLLRPDQHVAARWRQLSWPAGHKVVRAAMDRASGVAV